VRLVPFALLLLIACSPSPGAPTETDAPESVASGGAPDRDPSGGSGGDALGGAPAEGSGGALVTTSGGAPGAGGSEPLGGAPGAGGEPVKYLDSCPGETTLLGELDPCAADWCPLVPTGRYEAWPCEVGDLESGACEPDDPKDFCCCEP
jgi:hypothetical protein